MKDSQKTKKQLLQEIQQLRDQLNNNRFSNSKQLTNFDDVDLSDGILNNLWLLTCCYDADFKLIYVNDAFCRFFGCTKEKMLGQSYLINIPEDKHAKVQALHKELSVDNPSISIEDYITTKNYGKLYLKWNKRAVFNSEGEVLYYISTGEDITRSKRAELKLDDTKARFEALSDASFDAIFLSDKGVCVYQNQTAREMFGYSDEEAFGRMGTDWIIPEDRETVLENIKTGFEGPYEVTALRKDGTTFPCTIKAKMMEFEGKQIRFTSLSDSSELKLYKRNLDQNEVHFRTLIKTIPDLVWLKDPNGTYLSCNPRFECLYNAKEKDIVGKKDYDFVPTKLADFFRMHDQMAIANSKPTRNEEELIFADDGHHEMVETIKTPMFDQQGKLVGVLGVARDITRRKEAELLLQKSEEKYRLLFHNMFNAFALHEIIFDDQGKPIDYRFLEANEAFYRKTNLKPEEVIGRLVTEVMPGIENDPAGWIERYGAVVTENKSLTFEQYSVPLDRWYSITAFKVADNMFATIFEDISDRKKYNQQLKNLANIVKNSVNEIYIFDCDTLKFIDVNQSAIQNTGYTKKELLQLTPLDVKYQLTEQELRNMVEPLIRGEKKSINFESKHRRKDQTEYDTEVHLQLSEYDNKQVIAAIILDVTEKNKMMEALAQSEERFDLAMNATQDGLFDLNLRTNELYVSPGWKRMLGYEDHELENSLAVWESLTNSEDVKKTWQLVDDLISGKSDRYDIEFKMKHKDGHWIDVLSRAKAIYNEDGKAIRLIGTHVDITERKQASQRLEESEEKFRLLTELSPVGIYMTDKNGKCIYTNSRWQEMAGLSEKESIGDGWIEGIHPDDRQHVFDSWQKMIDSQGSWGTEYRFKNKTGREYYVYGLAKEFTNLSGQTIGYIGVNLDITDRKKAEEALKEATQRELEIVKATNIGLWNWDISAGKIEYSSVWKDPLNYDVQKITIDVDEWRKGIHPDDIKRVDKQIQHCFDNGIKQARIEFRLKYQAGTYRWILSQASIVFDEKNSPVRMRGTHIDISERKEAEINLKISEEKFRSYIEKAPNSIFVLDETAKIIEFNKMLTILSGYSENELLDMNLFELLPPDTVPYAKEVFEKLIRTGNVSGEISYLKKNGDIGFSKYDVTKIAANKFLAFINDITETKKLRELQSRAERLETAGTIAGQVAHDFNNLLGPIMAYPEFIRDELEENHTARAYLDDIENAASKIAEINQDLLTLGRRGHYNLDLLNLNSIVSNAVEEMKQSLPQINFELNLDDSLMNVKGGGAQIHRMLVNLLSNARDAIMETGNISVMTENYYADDTSFAYGRVPRGEYVKITVTDDGCGIPPDIINRILDPFFSTKSADKKRGSGLGLSVVDAVMKDHKGFIDLSSRVGHGTSFYLYFPITREESSSGNNIESYEGNESILIIDDDAVQREVSSNLLRKLGYTVTCAESGEQGLVILQKEEQDLLVLDMVMPDGIDGTETFRLALEINPKQKAIIVSGYAESERVREARQLGVQAFVKKPLTKKIIGQAVRTELDQFKKINY